MLKRCGDKAKIKISEILLRYCIYYLLLMYHNSALDAFIEVPWVNGRYGEGMGDINIFHTRNFTDATVLY